MSNVKNHPWRNYNGYEKVSRWTKEELDAAIAYKLANGYVLVSRGIQQIERKEFIEHHESKALRGMFSEKNISEVHWAYLKNTKHKRKAVRR